MFLPLPRKTKTREKPGRHWEKQRSVTGLLCYGYLCVPDVSKCAQQPKGSQHTVRKVKENVSRQQLENISGPAETHPRQLQLCATMDKDSKNRVGECKELVQWTEREQKACLGGNVGPLCRKLAQIG